MADEPIYPVIELQAENTKLKDDLIELLKKQVADLEKEVGYLRSAIAHKFDEDERDQGSHMIAPPIIINKPRVRTMSEVGRMLEARSINAANGKLSAEDINEQAKTS